MAGIGRKVKTGKDQLARAKPMANENTFKRSHVLLRYYAHMEPSKADVKKILAAA